MLTYWGRVFIMRKRMVSSKFPRNSEANASEFMRKLYYMHSDAYATG